MWPPSHVFRSDRNEFIGIVKPGGVRAAAAATTTRKTCWLLRRLKTMCARVRAEHIAAAAAAAPSSSPRHNAVAKWFDGRCACVSEQATARTHARTL